MFDMRFVSSRAASGLGVEAQPYFTFPGYVSSLYTDLDVSPELNVMATSEPSKTFLKTFTLLSISNHLSLI